MNSFDARSVAALIDHTLLKPEVGRDTIARLCEEAQRYSFFSVCVNPMWVTECAARLADSGVRICSVAGFPLGANITATKTHEALLCIRHGAHEIDMVLPIGALKGGQFDYVEEDIREVADAVRGEGALLKVILETALLDDEQKRIACELAVQAGAHFVKTSTGFSSQGSTAHDVKLMRDTVGPEIGVKASGGIRTLTDLRSMVEAGANRIGASASVAIIEELGQ